MESVKIKARGKVNLSLNITGERGGMHLLESVITSVDIADTVSVSFDKSGEIAVKFENADVPNENSAVKALRFLRNYCLDLGAKIIIEKGIPLAGGLGGSSADAAAVIFAALKLMPDCFNGKESDVISKSVCVGSDVPAMIEGGCVHMRGTGDMVTPIKCAKLHIVLASAGGGVQSGAAYKKFDEIYPQKSYCPSDNDLLISALKVGDIKAISRQLNNALYIPSSKLCPQIDETMRAIKETGAIARFMTGSGSCCAGLYENEEQAERAASELMSGGLWAQYAPSSEAGNELIR